MAKRSGQRAVKQGGANGTTRAPILRSSTSAGLRSARGADSLAAAAASACAPVQHPDRSRAESTDSTDAAAELSRMIAELNEVRMRLDAIVRKLAQSAVEMPSSAETVEDVERLRIRLVGKLDRIREQLVTRLDEERVSRDR